MKTAIKTELKREDWEKYYQVVPVKQDKKGAEQRLWMLIYIDQRTGESKAISTHMTEYLAKLYARYYTKQVEKLLE